MTTLRSGSATDVGKVRTSNQDVALEDPDLLAVADGMGGHAGGEVAARIAVDSLRAAFRREPTFEGLRRAVAEANLAVWRQGQSESGLRGMGTTLTATALVEEREGRQAIALANVGDSRAYVFQKGEIIQVTADHSLAEEKVRQGQLTEAEAAVHPHRHILTRALGVSSDVDVDLWELHLHDGDRILLCSDGLTNEIGDDRIGQILGRVKDPSEAAKALVKAAVDHGGSDNVTCIVIDVVGAESPVVPGGVATATAALGVATADGGGSPQSGVASRTDERAGSAGVGAARGTSARGGTSNGARSAVPARALRPVVGTGTSAPARQRPKSATEGNGSRTIAVVGKGDRAAVAGAGGPTLETRGVTNGGPGQGSGSVLAPNRLQAAELRRLQPTRVERRRRRRRSGAQRLLTLRLLLFFLIFLAVVAAGYFGVRWYASDAWYVGIDHGHLAVYRGRPGGFLWLKPRLVRETTVTKSEVPTYTLPQLRADRIEPSFADAMSYVHNLHAEYVTPSRPSTSHAPPKHPARGSKPTTSTTRKTSTSTTGGATTTTGGATSTTGINTSTSTTSGPSTPVGT